MNEYAEQEEMEGLINQPVKPVGLINQANTSAVIDRVPTAFQGRFIERRIRFYEGFESRGDVPALESGYYAEAHPYAIEPRSGRKMFADGCYFGAKTLMEKADVFSSEKLVEIVKNAGVHPNVDRVLRTTIALNEIIMPEPIRYQSDELDPVETARLRREIQGPGIVSLR